METNSYFQRFLKWGDGVLRDESGTPSSKRVVGIMCGITLCLSLVINGIVGKGFEPSQGMIDAVTALAFGCLGLSSLDKIFGRKKEPGAPVAVPEPAPEPAETQTAA